jgi:hypothetical protein
MRRHRVFCVYGSSNPDPSKHFPSSIFSESVWPLASGVKGRWNAQEKTALLLMRGWTAMEGPMVSVRAHRVYALRAYLFVVHHRPQTGKALGSPSDIYRLL